MAFAKATLVQRVRDVLGTTEFEDYITADPTTGTSVTVPDTTVWEVGSVGEFQDDGEQFLVRALASATVLTVKRAHGGTTAASSHAINVVVIRDPVYTYKRIVDSINLTIEGLFPWAWKSVEQQLTYDSTKSWYDLAAAAIDLIQIFQLDNGTPTGVHFLGSVGSLKPVNGPVRGLPTSLVASGVGLRFPHGLFNQNTVYVDYRAKLTTTLSGSDYTDFTDGISTETVAYGAAARLVKNREVPRVSQDDTQMADASVEPFARYSVGQELWNEYLRLRNTWYDELMRTIPPAKQWSR